MNKYQLVNEKWVVTKTAQTYTGAETLFGNEGDLWLGSDGSALKELSLKTAIQYMTYVYGPAPFNGFGKFIEGLESSKEIISYLDADYSKNIDAIKEDFDEVRQKNIDTLSAMQKASTISGKTFKGIRGMGADSQTGSPGQGPTGGRRGKSQLTLD